MKHLRRICLTLAIMTVLVIGFSAQAFADDGGYTIKDYKISTTLHENNTVSVTEKITVNFYHLRHGIYRSLPTVIYVTRDDGNGPALYTYRCKVKNIEISGDEWEKERNGYEYVDIKIGDSSKRIKGNKTYVIKYDYQMPDDRVSAGDFIYYSVLGTGWNTTTDKFTFSMKFDKPLQVDELNNLQVYSGPQGERSNALNVDYKVTKNKITGSVKNVPANNAVTIYAPLREGYFKGEMRQTRIPAIIFLIALILLIAATVYLGFKNRRKRPDIELCALAPDKLCPAEIGTIIDESVDREDVFSMIPWFAQQGYLTIEERTKEDPKHKKTTTYAVLHKVKNLPEDAPFYQKTFFSGLFSEGDTCDLSALPKSFADDYDITISELRRIFRENRKLSTGGGKAVLMLLLIALAEVGFITFSNFIGIADIWVGALIAAVGFFFIGVMAQTQAKLGRYGKGRIARVATTIVSALGATLLIYVFCDNDASMFSIKFIFVTIFITCVGCALTGLIIRPTDYKLAMMGKVVGFKKFIKSSEIADLEEIQESNPNHFFQVLPYAMAFGLSITWAKKYKKVKKQPEKPDWYTTASAVEVVSDLAETVFDVLNMTKSIETNVAASIGHSVDAAKGSSSDGGSSGGGGGGGGGGSW